MWTGDDYPKLKIIHPCEGLFQGQHRKGNCMKSHTNFIDISIDFGTCLIIIYFEQNMGEI